MAYCILNEKIHNKIFNGLDNSKNETGTSQQTYYKSIYSPATLMNDWYEKRTSTVQTTSSEPLLSENMDKYRNFCTSTFPDRKEYFTKVFEGYGLGQELLLDHAGFTYYNNYVTTYDLMFNHLTKGVCGPHPRRYYKCQYLPELDLTKIYGNLTQWGLKEQVYNAQKKKMCPEKFNGSTAVTLNNRNFQLFFRQNSLAGFTMESEETNVTYIVKSRELETTFLNSPVITPFCILWSKDNKISVIVEGGVFIYELWPNPLTDKQTVTFSKSWIPAHASAPLSNVVAEGQISSFSSSIGRKQAYEACIDSTLSYAFQKPNNTALSQVIQCEFSPLIGCKSYISCLTNHGLLQIYKDSLKKWVPVMNLTQMWISHCTFHDDQKKADFNALKTKMFKLKITTMKWIEKPEIIFMTGHENGEIVLWKVDVVNENFGMSAQYSYRINGKPICLHLTQVPQSEKYLLFIGTLSGVVKCLSIDLNTGLSNEEKDIWKDKDFLAPNLIISKYIGGALFLISVKRHILLFQTVSVNELNHIKVLNTQWEEFPTNITSWNEYQDSFIISLQNHDVYMLTLKLNDEKVKCEIKLIELEIKKKHKNSYSCYGLAMSQNKAIWILASSLKQNYDSLKEITQLIIYSPEIKVFRSLKDHSSSGLIEQILKEYKFIQLNDIFDLLELKKLELLTDFSKFKNDFEINSDTPLVYLQLLLWEVKLKLVCNFMESDSLVSELELAITRHRARKVISDFQKNDSLSPLQKRSLDVCEMFLMNTKEKDKSLDEFCSICSLESFCYNIRISSCSNLHKFPRCCLSLLPCDAVPYAVCRLCESVALKSFVLEEDNRCPYCDGLLEVDTRFRSTV